MKRVKSIEQILSEGLFERSHCKLTTVLREQAQQMGPCKEAQADRFMILPCGGYYIGVHAHFNDAGALTFNYQECKSDQEVEEWLRAAANLDIVVKMAREFGTRRPPCCN